MHLHIAFYMLENVGLFCRGVTVSLWLENVSLNNSGTRLRILSSRRESQHKNVLKNLHRSFCRFSPIVERFNSRRLFRFALSVFKIPWLNLSVHGSQLPLMVFIYNCRNKKNQCIWNAIAQVSIYQQLDSWSRFDLLLWSLTFPALLNDFWKWVLFSVSQKNGLATMISLYLLFVI